MRRGVTSSGVALLLAIAGPAPCAEPAPGDTHGSTFTLSAAAAAALISGASVAVPAQVLGPAVLRSNYAGLPQIAGAARRRVAVVLFLHDGAGPAPEAMAEWQQWLADEGIASIVPDSSRAFERPGDAAPASTAVYENVHSVRASEVDLALAAVRDLPWADLTRLVLAGEGEGAVAVARYPGHTFAARIIFGWSCEDNFFVSGHRTVAPLEPVLNVISSSDPLFSSANPALGNPEASGNCAHALANAPHATVVVLPGAPHSVLNLPAARVMTLAWLKDALAL